MEDNLESRMTRVETNYGNVITLLQEVRADVKGLPNVVSEKVHAMSGRLQAHLSEQDLKIHDIKTDVQKTLQNHEERIDNIESDRDKARGVAWALHLLWAGAIAAAGMLGYKLHK